MEQIEEIVRSMIGLECTEIQNPYGSILCIDLGEMRLRPDSPPKAMPHGFRSLTVYSPWRLEDDNEVWLDWNVTGGFNSPLARHIPVLLGQTVTHAHTAPPGWDLTITWSGGLRLVIFGDAVDVRDTAWFILGWDGVQVSARPILRPLLLGDEHAEDREVVSTAKLREVFDVLLSHIERVAPSVELREDYYWAVPAESWYNPYEQPSGLTLGQLSDDWSELEKIRSGQREPHPHALVWLASILRYTGEAAVRQAIEREPNA
jgi:hypothetical protein